jgi:hypothetical protein
VQLQVREPVAGVTLEAYVKCDGTQAGLMLWDDDELDQGPVDPSAHFAVRCRWFRANVSDDRVTSSSVCHFHPDRPAAFYCGFWKTELSSYGYMFAHACHCSLECFAEHFQVQRAYWERAHDAKLQSAEGTYLKLRLETNHFLCLHLQFIVGLVQGWAA